MFRLMTLRVVHNPKSTFRLYTDLECEVGDLVVAETRHGLVKAKICEIDGPINYNPFKRGNAVCRIIENSTKQTYLEEGIEMNQNVVEVRHISSNRVGIYYTDLALEKGDLVVYDRTGMEQGAKRAWSVGEVIDVDPDCRAAANWIIDKVDTASHEARLARIRELASIRAQLDKKKRQFEDLELLQLIAKSDQETAELLERYSALMIGD